jgi:hypothetical protein
MITDEADGVDVKHTIAQKMMCWGINIERYGTG